MAIRFGNLGLESLDHVDGTPGDEVTLIVDAPSGKGLFRADRDEPETPVETHRTLKVYKLPHGLPMHEEETCKGRDWQYLVRYRSREGGKWRTMSSVLHYHSCVRGIQISITLPDGHVLEWSWDRKPERVRVPKKPGKLVLFPVLAPSKPGPPN